MKRGIELNGVANISMLLQLETNQHDNGTHIINNETLVSMKEQVDLLERYMLAYNKAINEGKPTPMWHDVRANPKLYPTNRETAS